MEHTIGQAARLSGCAASTIRYYERIGLLPLARRGLNGYRYYGDKDLERLEFIAKAREMGFSIDSIRSLLRLSEHPEQSCEAVDEQVAEQLATIRSRIDQLRRLQTQLKQLQSACEGGYSVGGCGILSALSSVSVKTDKVRSKG